MITTALFALQGALFATLQNVWVDETTQLLGSRLPLLPMLRWLAGQGPSLGVPPDRMPPVSYLAVWTCGRTLCASEMSFRLLHLGFAAVGVAGLTWLAASRLGVVAGLVAGALLALSPHLLVFAVEIRAYALFFALAVVALILFWRIVERPGLSRRTLMAFWLVSLLTIYTHFFGLVMAGAYGCGLLTSKVRRWRDVRIVALWGASLLVASAGLIPFATGAQSISNPAAMTRPRLADLASYAYQWLAGPETLLIPVLAILFFTSLGVLLSVLGCRVAARATPWRVWLSTPLAGVLVALVAGLAVTLIAAFIPTSFPALKAGYSLWMRPPMTMALAAACAAGATGRVRRAATAAAALLFASSLGVTVAAATHARWFVHGPERTLAALVVRPRDTALVHETPIWGYGYYASFYRFGPDLAQYARLSDGALHRVGAGGEPSRAPIEPHELAKYCDLVVAAYDMRGNADLRRTLHDGDQRLPVLPAQYQRQRAAAERVSFGLYGVRARRYERCEP